MVTGEKYPSERFMEEGIGGNLPDQKIHTPDSVGSIYPFSELEDDDQYNEDKSVVGTQSFEMTNGNMVEYRMEETDEGYEVVREKK